MDKLSDEMITAWLDGEMTPEQRDEVEAVISAKPELGMRIARLSRADRLLTSAFSETLNAPIPERFDAMLGRSRKGRGLAGLREALSGLLEPRPVVVAATSLVFGIALGGVLLAGSPAGPGMEENSQGRMVANGPMAANLASVASGASGGALGIRLTVIDNSGRFCRQFETGDMAGLACLEGGAWVIDTLSQANGTSSAVGAYVLADGSTNTAIAAALQRRGIRQILDRHEESAAITSGWTEQSN